MAKTALVITYDVGTTGSKTCLYSIGKTLEFIDSHLVEYPLYTTEDGGAEQKADDWWNALCKSTKIVLEKTGTSPSEISGVSFCCQMQGSVLVDKNGTALRNPMIYLDGRAVKQIKKNLHHGLFRIEKINIFKLINTVRITGGIAATPKDPLWKYLWVKENEPEIYKNIYKWLDVKDYLIQRCTGQYGMTQDSAHITFIYDTRPGKEGWHKGLCKSFGINMKHLPPVVQSTDIVGNLTEKAATDLGLSTGTPVIGGGGDVTLSTIGAGCLDLHDTHIYIGTSGWVTSNVDKRHVDINNFIASVSGAIPGRFNYVAEQETSGACLQWVRDHLAFDAIEIYLNENKIEKKDEPAKLNNLLNVVVESTEPGASNAIFTPWLHGNRSPREDSLARGMFFNLGINTGKRQMIRAVLEGVAFHKRWMLEAIETKFPLQETIRFVGGGAKSKVWCQIMADVTGRKILTVKNPQNIGTAGAAIICGIGLKLIPSFEKVKKFIPVDKTYFPRPEYKHIYDKSFDVFKSLYKQNKDLFKKLNA